MIQAITIHIEGSIWELLAKGAVCGICVGAIICVIYWCWFLWAMSR